MKSVTAMLNVDEDMPISNAIISKQIERAQGMVESRNFSVRKHVLSYDNVMNKQREIIYAERNKVLMGADVHEQIVKMIEPLVQEVIGYYADYKEDYTAWDYEAFNAAIEQRLLPAGSNYMTKERASCFDVYKLRDDLAKLVIEQYEEKIAKATADGINFSEIERLILLKTVDSKWMDHIDAMDQLRKGIGLRAYGQRDPVIAYQNEGFTMFEDMISRIHTDTAVSLIKITVEKREQGTSMNIGRVAAKPVVSKKSDVGRNDPCPCGSGKKFKNCCGQ